MAEPARSRAAPLHPGLPDEIFIWEILLRLPPNPLLRCRAVCRAWRRATSTRDFLLAHHDRQPALPLLCGHNTNGRIVPFVDMIPFDHRAGVAAGDKLQGVARLGYHATYINPQEAYLHCLHPEASCDGLLILSSDSSISDVLQFSVYSPATRQYAPLPLLSGFNLAGMYPHPPTGEYRLLLYPDATLMHYEDRPPGVQDACYVYALGSCQPPRHIGWPQAEIQIHANVPALFRGSLHWFLEQDDWERESSSIMVFDTTTETFREMRAPAVPGAADLLEMDGVLGMASFSDGVATIDIWTMQDYDSELWAFKCRVELPVAELTVRFGFRKCSSDVGVAVSSWDDDVLILVQSGDWLLHIDMAGKLVSSFHRSLLFTTKFRLKETLVHHAFFPTMEGYVVNTWPFISLDDSVVNTCLHLKIVQSDGAS